MPNAAVSSVESLAASALSGGAVSEAEQVLVETMKLWSKYLQMMIDKETKLLAEAEKNEHVGPPKPDPAKG